MKDTINFEKAYLEQHGKKQREKKNRGFRLAVMGLFLCVAVMSGAAALMKYSRYSMDRDCSAVAVFLSASPEALEYERLQGIQDEYRSLAAYNDGVETKADIIRQRPLFTVETHAVLRACMTEGMTLQGLAGSSEGTLAANFACLKASDAASYVEAVRRSGFFETVSYNGWNTDETYCFQVNCVLKGE